MRAGPLQYDQIHGRIGAHQMWYDRRTASPLEPLSRRTMASKRRLFEMRLACLGGGLVLALSLSSGCSHTEDSVGFVLLKEGGEWYLEEAPQTSQVQAAQPSGSRHDTGVDG